MTELQFLLGLLLDHKLPKQVQTLIKLRLKEVEQAPQQQATTRAISSVAAFKVAASTTPATQQAASTQAILDGGRPTAAPTDPNLLAPIMRKIVPVVQEQVVSGSGNTIKSPRKF